MPIFEYVCKHCGSRFEKLVLSPSRARQIHCPECTSNAVEKAVSLFGASMSGSSTTSAANCAPSG